MTMNPITACVNDSITGDPVTLSFTHAVMGFVGYFA